MLPPALPADSAYTYTACYCEENAYLLARALLQQLEPEPKPELELELELELDPSPSGDATPSGGTIQPLREHATPTRPDELAPWEIYVVVVSNGGKTVRV